MCKGLYKEWLKPENLLLLKYWAQNGRTHADIATNEIGIAEGTLYRWKAEHREIREALTRAREISNASMAESMRQLGHGYTITLKKPVKVKHVEYDEQTGKKVREWEEVVEAEQEEHIPANFNAQKCWLYNHDRLNWHDTPEQEAREDDGTGVVILPARTEGAEDGGAD